MIVSLKNCIIFSIFYIFKSNANSEIMKTLFKIAILLIFFLNEINCRLLYCDSLFSGINNTFEGIQVYSHRFNDNNGNIGLTLRMYKKESKIKWDFELSFDKYGRAVNLYFIENSMEKIDSKTLNMFSFSLQFDKTLNKRINYECILRYQVFINFRMIFL